MTKLILKYLFIAIGILLVIYVLVRVIHQLDYKEPIIETDSTIDSLNNIIESNNVILKRNEVLIDSLYNNKSQIINRYETTIENYFNPTIVSDDSISRYISKELYNWKR